MGPISSGGAAGVDVGVRVESG